ncbi:helix-turn-helix transcriptional regulator [Actinomadura rubrisoli]|uniref:Helix-turn-helix transcriptional regulator n=1 Tax=Actinomadura rubrisoli TaxID=2530368 RepID=A0A4R5BDB3_9ACTN|nr:helix-turn-helix transcriptional regulator [Actinomadura rubrisoli]TDD82756.1 helix-turn-helix transcriptional regulator [Actinomadura rubrisoli]
MNARTTSPVLVGRVRESGELDAAFRAAREGSPSAVLLGGEAGVGKTRLISEFGGRARAEGARLLVGGCLELGTEGLPFAPFTAAMRGLVRDIGVDGVRGLLPAGAGGELGRLLPDFGESDGDAFTGEARARLFELVLTLLERLAAAGPVVLVVEDAHWADRSTRDLLMFLVRNLGSAAPLLVIATYRTDELHRSHPLRPLLTGLDRLERVRRVEVPRLGRDEVSDLVREILGERWTARDLDEVFARSEGNPLFVEALVGSGGGPDLPESLRDLLLGAVQRLPEDTQEILRVASGGGARIEHELLAAVAGTDERDLTRGLRPAVASNILVVDGDGYAFRHALIREAVHDDLLPGELTRLHVRYAEALEERPGLMPDRQRAMTLAHHWHAAHDAVRALTCAWLAVGETRKALAYAEALRMASRVLELWDRVPDAEERIGRSHADVMEDAVMLAELGGEGEAGVRLATAALAEASGDPARAARLYERRGRMGMRIGRDDAVDDLRAAARIVPADPPSRTRARVLATLAFHTVGLHGTVQESRAAADEAMAVARAVGDVQVELDVDIRKAWDELFRDDDPEAFLLRAGRVAERAEEIRAFEPLLRALTNKADVLEMYGRHREAADVAALGIVKAEEYGVARTTGTFLAFNTAEPLFSLGRWDEALAVLGRALAQDPPSVMRGCLKFLTGEVAASRGDLGAAARDAAEARGVIGRGAARRAQDLFPVCRLEALIALARGRPAQALEALGPVLTDRGLPDDSRYALPALVTAATACAALGDTAPLAAARARVDGLRVYGPVQEAHRLTFAAEAARAEGASCRDEWEAAAKAWDALDEPHAIAFALTRAAEAAAADGDRDAAAARLRRAAGLADGLGAVPLREKIDRLARRARVTLGDGTAREPGPGLGLTRREAEVLRLVAEGRTNREIAEALFISAKTASVHVSNILGKLGVSGRGEAAATAHRLHLFDGE